MSLTTAIFGFVVAAAGFVPGDDAATSPRPIPLTRPEMKQLLEDMKSRKPRIPLPPLTDEEKARISERAAANGGNAPAGGGGGGGGGYEGRLRTLYMPAGTTGGGGGGGRGAGGAGGNAAGARPAGASGGLGRNSDPAMTLDYPFKTDLFWIVSRTNNCQYCLGHQEMKLAVAGRTEEQIAGLDGDWSEYTPAYRAAYAFTRKLTAEPNNLNDADIDGLRKHYTDPQILEIILSVAGNNALNRWKEGVGVPQSQELGNFASRAENPPPADRVLPTKSFLTPTPDAFKTRITKTAVLTFDDAGKPTTQTICRRPTLESRAEVEKLLEACKARKSRLPLVEESKARQIISEAYPAGPLPNWVLLVANFPVEGVSRVNTMQSSEEKGDLTPLLKAQVSWIIARQDRAWYALGHAKNRLKELGQTDEQIDAIDGDWSKASQHDRTLFTLAKKLAASPVVLTDSDVEAALKASSPRDVVQLISYTTNRASFDRITEAAGLPLEK
jgi:hypothetical protein